MNPSQVLHGKLSVTIRNNAWLIDASIYIFHYYFALPDNWFSQKKQWPTAAVYGYLTFLIRLLNDNPPKFAAACFDKSLGSCFRNDIYPDYKSSRELPDEMLAFQLEACEKVTELLGIACFYDTHFEADDLIGSLYQYLLPSTHEIAILTRDKDLGQLLSREADFLWDYLGEKKFYSDDILQKFGVKPGQLIDLLAIAGDKSDDIPGVYGIGNKTAATLLQYFGTVENIIDNIDTVSNLPIRGAKGVEEKLLADIESMIVSKELATIVTDIPLISSPKDLRWKMPKFDALNTFCDDMGFPKLFSRIKQLEAIYENYR